ncbi:hypothetical protein [Coleofasciculus chthonoplastes]|uniref:hypothetical protein n=1 Tax=Coleofasciculus chthonoplastes TaxID=64178 RepID=UPI003300464D
MKIELEFENVPDNIENAIAEIRVEDQSEADAPAIRLSSKRVGPFLIQHSQPKVTLDVDLTIPDGNHELSILVRVKGHTQSNQPIEFLNTTTTSLPTGSELVQVTLSRIL